MEKNGYSGEYYSMAIFTFDLIISKETGQLLLQYQFNKNKLYQPKLWPGDIKVIETSILQCSY